MSNKLITFNNDLFGNIRTLTINDEPWFIGRDVAESLGYAKPQNAISTHVDEDDTLKQGIIDNKGREQQTVLINESGVYSLIFGSKKPEAKQFKRWVTKEILPELRKNNCIILEDAEDDIIDFNRVFGKYRLRKSFESSEDPRALFEQYVTLSSIEREAKRITNKDRERACRTIVDVLQTKIANEVLEMKPSQLLAIQELITDVKEQQVRWSNKRNGGIKSALTKQIAQLTEENEQLKSQNLYDEDDFFFIDRHPFSENYMYSYSSKGVVKSAAYHRWINNLNLDEFLPPAEFLDVDFTKPLRITLLYGHKEEMDTQNFGKSITDQLAEYWQFNDGLATEIIQSLHSYVDSYNDGYIYVRIDNINN